MQGQVRDRRASPTFLAHQHSPLVGEKLRCLESLRLRLERKRLWASSSFSSGSPPLPLAVEAVVVTCLLTHPPSLRFRPFTATAIPTLGLLSLLLPCVNKLCQDMAQGQSGTRCQQTVLAPLLPRHQVFSSQAFEGGCASSELGYQ